MGGGGNKSIRSATLAWKINISLRQKPNDVTHYDANYVRKTEAAIAVRRVTAVSPESPKGRRQRKPTAGAADSRNPYVLKVPCNKSLNRGVGKKKKKKHFLLTFSFVIHTVSQILIRIFH